jgi:aryl-alcohol dehydrogenase-like predicted oxidoreductase
VAYSPLGRGFLTGAFKKTSDLPAGDRRLAFPRFQGDNFAKNFELVSRIERFAGARGVSPAVLTLAWVLARGSDIVPIPGTKRRAYLEENLRAADVELTPSELEALDSAAPPDFAAGDRYPDMGYVNR